MMLFPNSRLILGSSSAMRRLLLGRFVESFEVQAFPIDESPLPRELPAHYVSRMALEKARAHPDTSNYILCADTIVSVGRRILRKAQDLEEAKWQMKLLSGRRHRVLTSVVLKHQDTVRLKQAQAHVAFKPLDQKEMDYFLRSLEWKNVAVYGLQGIAGCFVRKLNGVSSTVLGLPLFESYQLIRGMCPQFLKMHSDFGTSSHDFPSSSYD
jgi:septum formation protein